MALSNAIYVGRPDAIELEPNARGRRLSPQQAGRVRTRHQRAHYQALPQQSDTQIASGLDQRVCPPWEVLPVKVEATPFASGTSAKNTVRREELDHGRSFRTRGSTGGTRDHRPVRDGAHSAT